MMDTNGRLGFPAAPLLTVILALVGKYSPAAVQHNVSITPDVWLLRFSVFTQTHIMGTHTRLCPLKLQ